MDEQQKSRSERAVAYDRLQSVVKEYVEGCYHLDEASRILVMDAIQGLLVDDDFLVASRALEAAVSERLHIPPMEADETDALLRAIENGVRNVLNSTPLVVAQYAYQALLDEQAKSNERPEHG